ncbi:RluA family pseudouridine synthase [Candidatus Berkelbacteria bacterium]|nr:RluA family pseudouridine synthase [Candidatus Berkelbacteria bacterium]
MVRAEQGGVEDSQIQVIQETDDWVAIDKPPGLVIHDVPGEKHAGATLVDWLREHIPAINQHFSPNNSRPGIIHRLDADTSGVILVAKTPKALNNLQDQFRNRGIEKEYVALVYGETPPSGEMKGNISRLAHDTRQTVRRLSFSWEKAITKPAETRYERNQLLSNDHNRYSLLILKPKTGRTHQLRVQLLDAGWPIIGDQTYNTKESRAASQQLGIARQFLHAKLLQFNDPATGHTYIIEAPLASDLTPALEQLKRV